MGVAPSSSVKAFIFSVLWIVLLSCLWVSEFFSSECNCSNECLSCIKNYNIKEIYFRTHVLIILCRHLKIHFHFEYQNKIYPFDYKYLFKEILEFIFHHSYGLLLNSLGLIILENYLSSLGLLLMENNDISELYWQMPSFETLISMYMPN